jgi:membrane-bound ClpP family serine protease
MAGKGIRLSAGLDYIMYDKVEEEHRRGIVKDWLIVLVALLDDIGALVLILLVLWFFEIEISFTAIVVMAVVLGTIVFIVHRAIIPSLHRRKATGSEGMLGLTAEVVEPLKPRGVVRVAGEYWKAKSVDEDIVAGEAVEVVGLSRLVLEVRRKAR